jgi:hypothetical protein
MKLQALETVMSKRTEMFGNCMHEVHKILIQIRGGSSSRPLSLISKHCERIGTGDGANIYSEMLDEMYCICVYIAAVKESQIKHY